MRAGALAAALGIAASFIAGCASGGDTQGGAATAFIATFCAGYGAPLCITPSPTPHVPIARCRSSDLTGSAAFGPDKYNPTPGPIDGILTVTLQAGANPCVLASIQTLTMNVGDGMEELPVETTPVAWRDQVVVGGTDPNTGGAYLRFVWQNWCRQTQPAAVALHVSIADTGTLSVPVVSSAGSGPQQKFPPCTDASAPSRVTSDGGFSGRVAETNLAPCRATDLRVTDGSYNESEDDTGTATVPERVADMWLGRTAKPGCTVTTWKSLTLTDGTDRKLRVKVTSAADSSRPPGHVSSVFGPTDDYERVFWTNWCGGRLRGPLHVLIELPNSLGTITWTVSKSVDADGNLIAPACTDPTKPSEVSIPQGL